MKNNEDMSSDNTDSTVTKKSKIFIVAAIIAAVIIVVLVIVIVMLSKKVTSLGNQKPQDNRATVSSKNVNIITEDNVEEMLEQLNKPVEDASYVCTMNVDWYFEDASQPSYNAYVMNSTDNTRTVYFDLALEEGLEILYSSPYIPVGETVNEVELNTVLEAGTYPAVVVYHMVDEEHQEVGSVTVTVMLHIEN